MGVDSAWEAEFLLSAAELPHAAPSTPRPGGRNGAAEEVDTKPGRLTRGGVCVGDWRVQPFPSALAYWGDRAKVFRRVLEQHGMVR